MTNKRSHTPNDEQHTPGPWFQSSTVLVCNEEARVIANCAPIDEIPALSIPIHQVDANARLIAAAPDLLKQLEHIVRLMEPLEEAGGLQAPGLATLNGARSAIQKARMA